MIEKNTGLLVIPPKFGEIFLAFLQARLRGRHSWRPLFISMPPPELRALRGPGPRHDIQRLAGALDVPLHPPKAKVDEET